MTASAERSFGRVAIVGAGQIGTALGVALRASGAIDRVGLLDVSEEVARSSLARGAGDMVLAGVDDALRSDAIVLAMPVPEIVRFVRMCGERLREGAFLIDTGSAKRTVVEAMRSAVPPWVHAIGGHPMAGTERPGPEGADPAGLEGALFVLTPVRDDTRALELGRRFAAAVGARPVELDADTHDRAVALVSHLPHLLAYALEAAVVATEREEGVDPLRLAAGGYRSATRLAESDPEMVAGFLSANGAEVRRALRRFRQALDRFELALDSDAEHLTRVLEERGRDGGNGS